MAGQGRWAFGTLLQLGDGGETPTSGGVSTTLSAQADAGDTVISVAAAGALAGGDLILIGGAGGQIREVDSVATNDITLTEALTYTVPNGATVVEVDAETFATLAEVKDIDGPGISLDTEDITPHDAVGGWEEFVPTILRSGEVTFGLNFVPGNAQHGDVSGGLINLLKNRTRRNFRLVLPTNPQYQWTFAAYVTGFSNSMPVGGVLGADVTLKVTGVLALEQVA
jgi:hypothetical protein